MTRWFVMLLPLAVVSSNAVAGEGLFTREKDRGWFFYNEQEIVLPEEPEEPDEPTDLPPQPVPAAQPPASPDTAEPGVVVLTAEWLRDNQEKFLFRAINDPSPANVRAYLYLQRLMMDKSTTYARRAAEETMGHPLLDESVRRPLATYAVNDLKKQTAANRDVLLKEISESAGLVYVFDAACRLCKTQETVLKTLKSSFGFEILPVSLDGSTSVTYPDARVDEGQADALGIKFTPALVLIAPDIGEVVLTQAPITLFELQTRILFAAERLGLITSEDYSKTTYLATDNLFAESVAIPETILDNPEQLANELELILSNTVGGNR